MSDSKIAIICRDGYKIKNLVEIYNLNAWFRVRSVDDLLMMKDFKGYICMKPYPPGIDEILTYLELNEYKNLTKHYKI